MLENQLKLVLKLKRWQRRKNNFKSYKINLKKSANADFFHYISCLAQFLANFNHKNIKIIKL